MTDEEYEAALERQIQREEKLQSIREKEKRLQKLRFDNSFMGKIYKAIFKRPKRERLINTLPPSQDSAPVLNKPKYNLGESFFK